MLNYTFSTREKVLICLMAVIGLGVLYYQLIFVGTNDQIASLESQISQTQDEIVIYQSQAAALSSMKEKLAEIKASGTEPTSIPDFDNIEKLMDYLNDVVTDADNYTLSFEDPVVSENDGLVHRSGVISFSTTSYDKACDLVLKISHGSYPCEVNALSIAGDKNTTTTTTANGKTVTSTKYTTSVEVTFFENPAEGMTAEAGSDIPEGNDWTVYQDL